MSLFKKPEPQFPTAPPAPPPAHAGLRRVAISVLLILIAAVLTLSVGAIIMSEVWEFVSNLDEFKVDIGSLRAELPKWARPAIVLDLKRTAGLSGAHSVFEPGLVKKIAVEALPFTIGGGLGACAAEYGRNPLFEMRCVKAGLAMIGVKDVGVHPSLDDIFREKDAFYRQLLHQALRDDAGAHVAARRARQVEVPWFVDIQAYIKTGLSSQVEEKIAEEGARGPTAYDAHPVAILEFHPGRVMVAIVLSCRNVVGYHVVTLAMLS